MSTGNDPRRKSGNEMYLPMRVVGSGSWDLMVRSSQPIDSTIAELRSALLEVDAAIPLTQIRKMESLVDRATSSRRVLTNLIRGFATLALGLAAIGLYGVISYMVTQQTKEIGVRMALGASAAIVRQEVVMRTLKIAALGVILGVVGAIAARRFLESLLYGVNAFDPGVYIAMIATVLLCALAAGYLPARRATLIQPMQALRAD